MNPLHELHADARDIFAHALRACDIRAAFDRHLRFDGATLIRQSSPAPIALERYREIFVIAFGKAALPMTATLLDRLPPHIPIRGICSAPELPTSRDPRIRYFAGGHPIPNAQSFEAAREVLRTLHGAKADTFIFFLVSGGGSAMLELPRDANISLEDTIAFHQALIASGAAIGEINTVRKHFSAVKGGRLADAAPRSEKLSLIISDVPLKNVECVASSPTLPDSSSPEQCREILDRFHLFESFPQAIRNHFRNLASAEPTELAEPSTALAPYEILLSDEDLANAARDHAQSLGYHAVMDNTCDDLDYREASTYLLQRFRELRREFSRLCLLSSGEVTVKLEGHPGRGGRNQQFALATAFALAKHPGETIAVLSAGSDGIDGNSAAAGAIADPTTLARARAAGIDPEAALAAFDSGTLFATLGDAILTGPTGNNLRDLRILLAT
jgi:glycerate 2-kinase